MLKIVIFANTSWSVYNFRKELLIHLIEKRYSVTVIAPFDEYASKIEEIGCEFIPIKFNQKGMNPFKELLLLWRIYWTIKKIGADLLINYTIKPIIYGCLAARLLNVRSLAITTGLGYVFTKKNLLSIFVKKLYKIAFKSAEEVWFLNEDDYLFFLQQKIVPQCKAKIIDGEGVDTNFFHASSDVVRENPNEIVFILISRMIKEKGIEEYVSAAQVVKNKYSNIKFKLIGDFQINNPSAIPYERIQHWVEKGYIEYLGKTDDIRAVIDKVDCVVLPSYYREGVPRVLLEAAAMGKPIITTNSVGCREVVIDKKSGFLCELKDVQSLILAIEQFLFLTDEQREIMGKNGRSLVMDRFSVLETIKKYDIFLNRLC